MIHLGEDLRSCLATSGGSPKYNSNPLLAVSQLVWCSLVIYCAGVVVKVQWNVYMCIYVVGHPPSQVHHIKANMLAHHACRGWLDYSIGSNIEETL